MSERFARVALAVSLLAGACARPLSPAVTPITAPPGASPSVEGAATLGDALQLVLVTTATWDTTGGELRRFERASPTDPWRPIGAPVPVVVGRTGLAWDDRFSGAPGTPVKREGDGRAPAGVFALDTVFGFPPASEAAWVRLPYRGITEQTECVDDGSSVHYNTIVDRATVGRVDWTSAEPMRRIDQYRLGVTVGYNATPPRAGRGSCIFLHIWAGPGTFTAGCTAMAERDLAALVLWMDRARRPVLVQLPVTEYARLREPWHLP